MDAHHQSSYKLYGVYFDIKHAIRINVFQWYGRKTDLTYLEYDEYI